ncbi:hypothetical protein BpHYR1_050121 [Brachionus plicatilis]|uniref:Uncharacterized protein n=1 Tax=Brachionus plicatilis TaxID=10195 RepID=A0A3M7RCZ8_BRAPC|nr:hypothetical protein BpHYR1_050121 [Brachionus plicatilis]
MILKETEGSNYFFKHFICYNLVNKSINLLLFLEQGIQNKISYILERKLFLNIDSKILTC